jgi:hypothetical protein
MPLIDAYCKIKIEWNKEELIYNLQIFQHEGSNAIINEIVDKAEIHLYCKNPHSEEYEGQHYLLEYSTPEMELALLTFQSWFESLDVNVGFIKSSHPNNDCLLFRTDHDGTFEIMAFNGLKHKRQDLYCMLALGELDRSIESLLAHQYI